MEQEKVLDYYFEERLSDEFLKVKQVETELKIIESLFEFYTDEFNNLYDNLNARTAFLSYYQLLKETYQEKRANLKMNNKEKIYDKYITNYMNYVFNGNNEFKNFSVEEKKKITKVFNDCFIFLSSAKNLKREDIEEDFCAFYNQNSDFLLTSSVLMDILNEEDYHVKSEKEMIDNTLKRISFIINTGEIPNYNVKYKGVNSNNYAFNKPAAYYLSSNNKLFNLTYNDSRTVKYTEFLTTLKANDVVFSLIRSAEQSFIINLSDKIYYSLHHITKEEEKLEKRDLEKRKINKNEELTEIYSNLFFVKDFLDSGLSKEKYCEKNDITYGQFSKVMGFIEKCDPKTFKIVQDKLRQGSMGFLDMMNTIKIYLKDYRPNTSTFSVIDFCAISSRTITEVIDFFQKQNDFGTASRLSTFYKVNRNSFKAINYHQLYSGKTIVKGREITKEDIKNIKQIIDEEGYPQIQGVYVKVRDAYLNDKVPEISKAHIIEKLRYEKEMALLLDEETKDYKSTTNKK